MNKNTWRYPRRVRLARLPTPLEPLRFSQIPASARVFVKRDDLTGVATTGNKVRKLEYLMAAARRANCDTVITCGGVQSNHARATAVAAAQLGLDCILFLRGGPEARLEANFLLDRVVGAEVRYLGKADYVHHRDAIMEDCARQLATRGHKAFVINEGGSNPTGSWGYVRALDEIRRQSRRLKLKVDAIVAAVGSGGTHTGLLLGTKLLGWNVPVFGINVCDDEDYFVGKILADLKGAREQFGLNIRVSRGDVRIIDGYVGEGYGRAALPIHDVIRCLGSETGLVLEPVYTGKAFYGMILELSRGRFGKRPTLVFVHTGGVFGLLTQDFAGFYR